MTGPEGGDSAHNARAPQPLSLGRKLGYSLAVLVGLLVLVEVLLAVFPWQRLIARDHVVAAGTNTVFLAVGDSVTYGDGVAAHQAYPAVLARELQERGLSEVDVVNLGQQGAGSAAAREQVERGLAALPEGAVPVVLWMVGHNDFLQYRWKRSSPGTGTQEGEGAQASGRMPRTLRVLTWGMGAVGGEQPRTSLSVPQGEKYAYSLDLAVQQVQARGGRFVVMTYLVPGEPGADMPAEQARIFSAIRDMDLGINELKRETAAARGLSLIDLQARVEVPETFDGVWFMDPIHPTPRGHRAIADTVRQALVMDGLLAQRAF